MKAKEKRIEAKAAAAEIAVRARSVAGGARRALFSAYVVASLALAGAAPVYADALSNAATKAANGIRDSVVGALPWVVAIVLVCVGVVMLVFGQRKREEVKESAPERVVGVILICAAIPLAKMVVSWIDS
jgi:type IV secretory pathway VirB2 component (pilin)